MMNKSHVKIISIIFASVFLVACTGTVRVGDAGDEDDVDAEVADFPGETDSGDIETERDGDTTGDAAICGNSIIEGDEECDDGNEAAGDGCENDCTFSCHNNMECSDPDYCNGTESCDLATHTCLDGVPFADGFVCQRDPRSICLDGECAVSRCGDGFIDTGAGESCDPPDGGGCSELCRWHCGTGEDCPDDGNICNGVEYCDYTVHECSNTNPLDDGTTCLADPRRICIAGTCQESTCGDDFEDEDAGEECDDGRDGDPDDGCTDACTFSCHGDADCEDANPCSIDFCDTITTHACYYAASPNDVLCRPSAGDCDREEYCDGTRLDCPPDAFAPAATMCRDSAGACDVAERCTGSSAACPVDAFAPPTTECRASAGACDVAEYCTGLDAACPGDAFAPLTTECRASSGVCDVAESCTGTSASCPEDGFVLSGTPCDDGRFCTNPDACDGAGICAGTPVAGLYNVTAIAAAIDHTCALMSTGGVKCWGNNLYGQLGDGTTTNRRTPVDVSGLSSAVPPIVSNGSYTCTMTSTGGVKCWGFNYYGQLGDGTTTNRRTPVDVSGLTSGVSSIAAGSSYTCAVIDTGAAKCWGNNDYGQLGDSSTTNRRTPVDVLGLSSGVTAMAADDGNTCSLMSTGGVKCWGRNQYGQLGDGSTTNALTPVDVLGLSSGATAIAAGDWHTCSLMSTGGVKCWGYNYYGQLGDGTTTNSIVPVDVSGLSSGVVAITAGYRHTCALMSTGGVKCWGYNGLGQLGDGSTTSRQTPTDVSGLSSGITAISCGSSHTCALMSTGGVKCWGDNSYGQLGDGTTTRRLTPVDVHCE